MTLNILNVTVDSDSDSLRLDIFISQTYSKITRSAAQRLIKSGNILVNSEKAKRSQKVREGDSIELTPEVPIPLEAEAEDIPIDIIYEDDSIVVVNKAANMVVHPAAGNYTGTLVNALLHHIKDLSGISGVVRPGIVHRLDKGTSGVMIVAKNNDAHVSLTDQFKERSVTKKYLALIFGRMKEERGIIKSNIGRDKKNRKKISSRGTNLKEALTHFEVKKTFDRISLLELTPKTGRTHQLRVHLSETGHPIVGDELYGGTKRIKSIPDTQLRASLNGLERFLLHAAYLKIRHPKTGDEIEFSAPMPDDFSDTLKLLEG